MILKAQVLPFLVISMIAAIIASTTPTAQGASESCQDVDLRSEALGPVRNQGESGWCGNFVAADLLSHQFGKRISALQVGIHYYSLRTPSEALLLNTLFAIPESEYTGALLSSALHINQQQLACLETSVPESLMNDKEAFFKVIASSRAHKETTLAESCVPVNARQRFKVVGSEIKGSRNIEVLKSQLLNKNIVGALVDMKTLFQLNAESNFTDRTFGNHYVSVVAQRKTNEQCEFLIRNSWGPECLNLQGASCEDGQYWIPSTQLKAALKSLIYLQTQ